MTADPTRRRWRMLCLAVGVLGLLVLAASALPWFNETRVFESGGSDTDPVNIWSDGPSVSARSKAGGVAALAGTGQWGLLVMIAVGISMLCGFFARGQQPGDPRLDLVLKITLGCAAVAPVLAIVALIGANSGERVSAVPHVGWLLTLPALLATLVAAVLMWRLSRGVRTTVR